MYTHIDQAESLRKAAQHRTFYQKRSALRCIAVASGKGGVGKTFITVNLAIAFQRLNRKVLIVDADLGLANADIILGVNPRYTLQDALFKGKDLETVITQTPYGVDLLAASSGTQEMTLLGQPRIRQFIDDLMGFACRYDIILFDCASGIDSSVTSFIAACPESIIVCTSQPTSMMDSYALLKIIYKEGICTSPGLVVNMATSDAHGQRVADKIEQVTRSYLPRTPNLLGIVPMSSNVSKSVYFRKPLIIFNEEDAASRRLIEMTKRIVQNPAGRHRLSSANLTNLVNGILQN